MRQSFFHKMPERFFNPLYSFYKPFNLRGMRRTEFFKRERPFERSIGGFPGGFRWFFSS